MFKKTKTNKHTNQPSSSICYFLSLPGGGEDWGWSTLNLEFRISRILRWYWRFLSQPSGCGLAQTVEGRTGQASCGQTVVQDPSGLAFSLLAFGPKSLSALALSGFCALSEFPNRGRESDFG